MRKPRDFNSELKALADKTKAIKERRLQQFGELVIATGADALDTEMLAGALLAARTKSDLVTREEWRKAGEAFFRETHQSRRRPRAKCPRPLGDKEQRLLTGTTGGPRSTAASNSGLRS